LRIAEVSRIGVRVEIVDSATTWITEVPEEEAEDIEGAEKSEENAGSKFYSAIS
jgi:hypothetical protein